MDLDYFQDALMTTLAFPILPEVVNGDKQSHTKRPYYAPTLLILEDTHIAGSIYELQEADAGNGNGAAS